VLQDISVRSVQNRTDLYNKDAEPVTNVQLDLLKRLFVQEVHTRTNRDKQIALPARKAISVRKAQLNFQIINAPREVTAQKAQSLLYHA